jgi:hypothetical protein
LTGLGLCLEALSCSEGFVEVSFVEVSKFPARWGLNERALALLSSRLGALGSYNVEIKLHEEKKIFTCLFNHSRIEA